MNAQTRLRIGDRVRVISVEIDAMRSYVGRLGTVEVPSQIPSGYEDHISVRFDKAKKFKAVSRFFKPECLTVLEIQEILDSQSGSCKLLDLQTLEVEVGGRCTQDTVKPIADCEPSTYAVGSAQVSHLECLSPEGSNLSDSVKLIASAALGSETDFQESLSIQTCDRSNLHFHQSMSSASQPPVSLLVMTGSAEDQKMSEIFSPTALQQSEQPDRDGSALKMFPDFSAVPCEQETSQGVSLSSFSGTFPAAGMMQNGFVSAQETLVVPSLDADCCWLESPGALSSHTSRVPGLSKSEGKWQKLGLLKKGEVANPDFLEDCFGLPKGWTSPQDSRQAQELLEQGEKSWEIPLIVESERSLYEESSTSTHSPCENFTAGKTWIDPGEIDLHAGTQSRLSTDWETVQRYTEQMTEGLWDWERQPLPVVFQDTEGRKYPGDAHHRTTAAVAAKVELICVDLRSGSLIDAIMFSCVAKANREHGLPLTAKDQRRRIEMFLETRDRLPESDERRRYSSREIARYLGLSESGYRTIVNIITEREMRRAISQFELGDRVQVVRSGAVSSGGYWSDGILGKVQDIDKKKGILVVPDMDKWMLKPGWIHPDNLIKSDAPLPELPGKISQDEEEPETDWQVDDLCQYRRTVAQIIRIDGDDVYLSLNGYLETVSLHEIKRVDSAHDSVLLPQTLVCEPKSKDKQLLPSIKSNSDIPLNTQTPTPAVLVNGSAIANDKPDVVAAEIAIGIRHLSPEQLAWALTSAANNGLSDDHLKAVVEAGNQILNLRHHPEYFPTERKITQRGEDMPSQCISLPPVDFAELHCLDDEDLTLGLGDEGAFLDDGDEGVFSDDGNFWLEEAS